MTLAAWTAGGQLPLPVRDQGSGLAPDEDRPGVGMIIITALASEVSVRSLEGHGTEITMSFGLS